MAAGGSAGDEADRLRRKAAELRDKAAYLEHKAVAYEKGQRGEIAVARVLDSLAADGYRHIDDVGFPGSKNANVDHVLVGPAGVFVIDAKEWGGRAEVREGTLHANGRDCTGKLQTIINGTRAVEQRAGLPERAIFPVACLTGEAQVSPTVVGDCTVVSLGELADGLRAMPARLIPEQVAWAYDRLDLVLERKSAKAAASPDIVRRAAQNARAGRPADREPVPLRRAPRAARAPQAPRIASARPMPRPSRRHKTTEPFSHLMVRLLVGLIAIGAILGIAQAYFKKLAKTSAPTTPVPSTAPAHVVPSAHPAVHSAHR